MSRGWIILAVLVVIVGGIGLYAMSAYNYGNRSERQIEAVFAEGKNVLAQYGQKLGEAAQITDLYRDDLVAVYTAVMEGRYGEDGSKAVFQFIQEQNPNLDSQVYVKLQQIIEAGRKDFEVVQQKLIDVKRSYLTALGSFPRGAMLQMFGYPKIEVGFEGGPDKFPVISTARANEVYEKGQEDEPIKVRP